MPHTQTSGPAGMGAEAPLGRMQNFVALIRMSKRGLVLSPIFTACPHEHPRVMQFDQAYRQLARTVGVTHPTSSNRWIVE
jgi:hypothetical protein